MLPEPVLRYWLAAMRAQPLFARTPWGAVTADPRWPDVWDANVASVLRRPGDLPLSEIRAWLDPALERAGAGTERIEFLDAEWGGPAMRELAGAGAEEDPDVVMLFHGEPARPEPAERTERPVEVTDPDEAFWSFYRSIPRFYGNLPDPVLDQVLDRARTLLVPMGLRCFLTTAEGRPAGLASMLVVEGVGYIDNVVTDARFRGRGIATAGVRACLRSAADRGAECVFLLAEEGGAAQRLYERIGFRGVATSRSYALRRRGRGRLLAREAAR